MFKSLALHDKWANSCFESWKVYFWFYKILHFNLCMSVEDINFTTII